MVTDKQVSQIIEQRCNSCHSEKPSDAVFTIAPTGLVFSNIATIKQWAPRIKARVIDAKDMPFMNKTGMTSQERGQLARWLAKVDQK